MASVTNVMTPRLMSPLATAASSTYFTAAQLRTIYDIPAPSSTPMVVAVMSFGGGLFGTLSSTGILTNGDVQAYWTSIGMTQHPTVKIIGLSGATNQPSMNDGGSTLENTIDVETIGGVCPSSSLTIILYLVPNTLSQFPVLLNAIYQAKPNVVSCSWGAPEIYFSSSLLSTITGIMDSIAVAGITICVATGDNGSTDGISGTTNYVDFPSSHPGTLAVGGTTLICPTNTYDAQTVETAWATGGGGISARYPKPAYQSSLSGTGRSTPDLASLADPHTGVIFLVNGTTMVVGGTSVSAPTMAGFLAAIHCTVAVTPLLYQAPSSCFHDLTSGSNGGYAARAGYDNCTGLGSIRGTALAAYLTPTTGITLYPTLFTMTSGQTAMITTMVAATIIPSNATNKTIQWTSQSPLIATINSSQITALKPGTAQLIAMTADGITAMATVVVQAIPVTQIVLSVSSLSLAIGETARVSATVLPANATQPQLGWSSSATSVATVSASQITAVSPGTATITVRSVEGIIATIVVTVLAPAVSSLSLSQSSVSIYLTNSLTLSASYLPLNANPVLTWSINNQNATLQVTGGTAIITANSVGTSVVTVRSDTITASCVVNIILPVSSITIQPSTPFSIAIGATKQFTSMILPTNAGNKTVTWTSSNPGVAAINGGILTGVSIGTTIITAQAENKTASVAVSVYLSVSSITLNATSLTLNRGLTLQGMATVLPVAAPVIWKSILPSVASVSSSGLITANTNGTTIITASIQDRVASMMIRVLTPVSGVSIPSTLTLLHGTTKQLSAMISPSTASTQGTQWSSSRPIIATVTGSGLVKGLIGGTTIITVTTVDGGFSAACIVTVTSA